MSLFSHLLYDACHKHFILLFSVLFVEYTIAFVFQSYASKTIRAAMAHFTIPDIITLPAEVCKSAMITVVRNNTFITQRTFTSNSYIIAVLACISKTPIFTVFYIFKVIAANTVFSIDEVVSKGFFNTKEVHVFLRKASDKAFPLSKYLIFFLRKTMAHICCSFFIFFFA